MTASANRITSQIHTILRKFKIRIWSQIVAKSRVGFLHESGIRTMVLHKPIGIHAQRQAFRLQNVPCLLFQFPQRTQNRRWRATINPKSRYIRVSAQFLHSFVQRCPSRNRPVSITVNETVTSFSVANNAPFTAYDASVIPDIVSAVSMSHFSFRIDARR